MFNPHFCYGRFVEKYKPVLLLLNEFLNIGFRFFFRLAHEPSPDFSLKKNPNSHYNTNLNSGAPRAREARARGRSPIAK